VPTRARGRVVLAAVVCLITSLSAVAAPEALAGTHTKAIANCTKAVYAPSHFIFYCADGGAGLRHVAYSRYTKTDAHGHGVYYWNDCKPSCAGGTWHHAQAFVHLYRMRDTKLHGPLFTRARVVTEKKDIFELPTKTIADY
jgi:hypothetical protein